MVSLGLDLGGTKVMAVLVDDGEVIAKAKKPTPREGGPDDVLDVLSALAAKVDPTGEAVVVGVGVPGPVKPGTGLLPTAVNLPGWDREVDVASALSKRLGDRPVMVDNDVNVGTLAEHRLGAGSGVENLLGVFLGTGVGAGLILDGRLRRGPRGLAGEIGHTFVDFHPACDSIGRRGELENYAGRRSLEARARELHAAGRATALVEIAGEGRMKSRVWEEALAAGDTLARELIDEAAEALASALASAIALVDIELIVLGGGMAQRLGDRFRRDVERRLAARTFAGLTAPIRAAALGDTGGALGAALLAEEAA